MQIRSITTIALLLTVACAAGPKRSGPPESGVPAANASEVLPLDAFTLLKAAAAESCAVCAREFTADAFGILDEFFPPGRVLGSDGARRFLRGAEAANELLFSTWTGGEPALRFRFHTAGDRLIGIAESDFTDGSIAARIHSLPEGASFDGMIEVVPFAYGDGAAYLYSPASRILRVHCRVIAIAAE